MVATPQVSSPLPPDVSAKLKAKALQALGELPPFSPVLSRLLATLSREDVVFSKLGELIEADSVIAGNILHMVNSALYARSSRINSVRHAISVLGVNKLRNAVLGMSVARLWKSVTMPSTWSSARFNGHSAATAILTDFLVQNLDVEYPEGGFIAGLLHDIGHLLTAWSLPDRYSAIQAKAENGTPWEIAEMEVLGFTHAELSAQALAIWKIPEPVQAAVRGHHGPFAAGPLTLAQVLSAADRYVKTLGYSIHPLPPSEPALDAILSLGLPRDLALAIAGDFQNECKIVMNFLQ